MFATRRSLRLNRSWPAFRGSDARRSSWCPTKLAHPIQISEPERSSDTYPREMTDTPYLACDRHHWWPRNDADKRRPARRDTRYLRDQHWSPRPVGLRNQCPVGRVRDEEPRNGLGDRRVRIHWQLVSDQTASEGLHCAHHRAEPRPGEFGSCSTWQGGRCAEPPQLPRCRAHLRRWVGASHKWLRFCAPRSIPGYVFTT